MDDGVVGTEAEGAQVGGHRPVKDPRLLQNIAQVDVSVEKGGVQLHCLERERDNFERS